MKRVTATVSVAPATVSLGVSSDALQEIEQQNTLVSVSAGFEGTALLGQMEWVWAPLTEATITLVVPESRSSADQKYCLVVFSDQSGDQVTGPVKWLRTAQGLRIGRIEAVPAGLATFSVPSIVGAFNQELDR